MQFSVTEEKKEDAMYMQSNKPSIIYPTTILQNGMFERLLCTFRTSTFK